VDPRRLVFVDECSTNVRMAPLRARAPRGERAFGRAPKKNWKENVTLISSISLLGGGGAGSGGGGGMGASMSIEGSADGEAFLLYVEHFLCPTLSRGQIVIMDNLQVHKMRRVRELIEERGCELVFLPSYSPDFNPIEEAFSKVKGILRKAKARSFETLVEASGEALRAVSRRDAVGFFAHCGYRTPLVHSL
jgi:transposase